uniref:U3 small nucleolar RNA-associated protein 15 C-terminal domain-containing protein n=1 Tax=Proboscia inermis TaxID=420281 RepID=A0A7S0GKB2_9STRA|mmetsp:Transcript_51086/g.51501  ORF Transcript_51086/g.51501 Transcript_51086/m.51501 type:complete len:112 (+) Transcript_51086:105-440(+)
MYTSSPQVSAVLEELVKRQGLLIALSNRDEETLEPILSFTARYITHPRYSHLLIQVSHIVCKVYGGVVGQSASIDELLDKLRQYVKEEILLQKRFLGLMGKIDAIVNAASF